MYEGVYETPEEGQHAIYKRVMPTVNKPKNVCDTMTVECDCRLL